MKLFSLFAFGAVFLCFQATIHAEKNKEFQERAEIYSRLIDCDYYKSDEYEYKNFTELSTLPNAQPTGYLARVPVYILGSRDGHIILSPTNTPNKTTDQVYEILLGGWGNTRAVLRKKIRNYAFVDVEAKNILSPVRPLKVVIEVSKDGHINVFTDNNVEPLLSAYDPNPLPVKYISFASFEYANVEYLYNCVSDKSAVLSANSIPKKPAQPSDPSDLQTVPIEDLVHKCKYEEHWENDYKTFHALSDFNTQAEGYQFKVHFYAHGSQDVHVVLSATDKPNLEKDSVYEIIIGGWKNTRHVIRRKKGEEVLEELHLPELLLENKQSKFLIQLTNNNELEVFVGGKLYKPVLWTKDPKPIPVKYISFASNDGNRVLVFYNCEGDKTSNVLSTKETNNLVVPAIHEEEVLNKKCKHYDAWENNYTDTIKLKSLANVQPEGYVVRLPLYIQGVRDAHILLSQSSEPDPNNGYEILLGGWGNLKTLIRKNGEVIAETEEYNVLNEFKPIKVLIEMTRDGEIRVLTEYNTHQPLLQVKDANPLTDLNTLSFTAYFRDIKFWYDCKE